MIWSLGALVNNLHAEHLDYVWDDMETANWTESDPQDTGSGTITGGNAVIFKDAIDYKGYSTVSLTKTFSVDFQNDTWVHFRFKMNEALFGSNMYTSIKVGSTDVATFNINGEQHWNQFGTCTEKTGNDDQITLVLPALDTPQTEVRVSGSGYGGINLFRDRFYDDWNLFSMKYESGNGKLRFYINGLQVSYCNLDAGCTCTSGCTGVGNFNNEAINLGNQTSVTIGLTTLTDGAEYTNQMPYNGNQWLGEGVRYRRCYASDSPSRPTYLKYPSGIDQDDKATWMKHLDVALNSTNIWNDIWAGNTFLHTAAMAGVLPCGSGEPYTSQYGFESWSQAQCQADVAYLQNNYPAGYSMPKRLAWQNIYATGNTALAVFGGYVTVREVHDRGHWSSLSSGEQAQIPDNDTAVDSYHYWDYVLVNGVQQNSSFGNRLLPHQDVRDLVEGLIYQGRIGVPEAVKLQLIAWEETEFNCPYLHCDDINELRASSLGNANYCSARTDC